MFASNNGNVAMVAKLLSCGSNTELRDEVYIAIRTIASYCSCSLLNIISLGFLLL